MKYWCNRCEKEFESEEKRCPSCLRMSTVVDPSQAGRVQERPAQSADGRSAGSSSLLRGPGFLVTLAILVPLMLLNRMEWHFGWVFTFVAALVGFGAGHAVNYWWQNRK